AIRIVDVRNDRAGLASGAGAEILSVSERQAGHGQGGVVLLGTVKAIGILIVYRDLIHFRRRLIHLRALALPTVGRYIGSAVVRLEHVIRIFWIDPNIVMIAVGCDGAAERLAAVRALEPVFVANEDDVGISRVDAERVVIERTRDDRSGAVHLSPGRA